MDNLKYWKKYENKEYIYYYLPEAVNEIKLFGIDQAPTKEKLSEIEKEINLLSSPHCQAINESVFSICGYSETEQKELVALPFGYYKHAYNCGSHPERLEKINIRDDVYFENQKLLTLVKGDILKFTNSEQIFKNLGFIHKRGVLLWGEPGSGKSAFIRNLVSKALPKEIQVIWTRSIPSTSFMQSLNSTNTFKVFVIEEITTFSENHEVRDVLDFLDGEQSPKNSIILATTNYPEELKQNMADRPSRFDLVLEVPEPNAAECKRFFEGFLKRKLLDDEVSFNDLSIAHIKEICLLSLMYELPLQECYDKVKARRLNFKKGFSSRGNVGFDGRNPVPRGR
jgi:predicted AAA+ superfamily ATPase